VRAVMIDGDVVEFGGEGLDAPGYDLLALITGSEGLLAIITEVTVKLTPKPQAACCVLAAFDELTKAGEAVAAIIGEGIIPAGLEMMDKLTIGAVEPFVHAGYPLDAEAILLCESDGVPEEVAEEIATVRELMQRCGATRVEVSQTEAQRLRFWSGRKAAFPAAGRISPDYYCIDGTIPRRALAPILEQIGALSQEFGLRCMNVFHAGDGNLHPLILYDANLPGDAEKPRPSARGSWNLHRRRRHDYRRAWRRRGENRRNVRAVCTARTGTLSFLEACVRSRRAAQSRQGRAPAAPLRRDGAHARPPR
jgi:glycolate oxidase